jgi:hypothetical protein
MAITITFDTLSDALAFIGKPRLIDMALTETPAPAPMAATYPSAADLGMPVFTDMDDAHDIPSGRRIYTDITQPDEGDRVRWDGHKFQFTGQVIEAFDNDNGDLVVRIRRDDTGKVVKITFDDAEGGSLYAL